MIDPDATVRLPAPGCGPRPAVVLEAAPSSSGAARGGHRSLLLAGAAAGLLALAGGGALLWREVRPSPPAAVSVPASPAPVPVPAPPPAAAPSFSDRLSVPLLSEAEILAHRAVVPAMLRLRENPRVFVLDFPDLETQGIALNRVAALIEKRGLPRDRVLTDAELAEAIARSGDTAATYYYGHNYRGSALQRFFDLARRDAVPLTAEEHWVQSQLLLARSLAGEGEDIAVISIPAADPRVSATMRAAILRHEVGHGHYFTRPAFAAHVARIWRERFTESERAAFRTFLSREGYDVGNEELVINETMAYLLFTPDAGFFRPEHVGMTAERVDALRAALRDGAPPP